MTFNNRPYMTRRREVSCAPTSYLGAHSRTGNFPDRPWLLGHFIKKVFCHFYPPSRPPRGKQIYRFVGYLRDNIKMTLGVIVIVAIPLPSIVINLVNLGGSTFERFGQTRIKDGKRIQSHRGQEALETCQRDIRRIKREIKKIEEPFKTKFATLRKKSKEFARIQGKQKVYHVDVELDQLLTSYRLTFANLLAFLAKQILDDESIEMNTLIQSILFLSGTIEQFSDYRKVYINKNQKDPKFMAKLSGGLSKLNALKIRHPSGAIYEFALN